MSLLTVVPVNPQPDLNVRVRAIRLLSTYLHLKIQGKRPQMKNDSLLAHLHFN